jgi:hypothetical protein
MQYYNSNLAILVVFMAVGLTTLLVLDMTPHHIQDEQSSAITLFTGLWKRKHKRKVLSTNKPGTGV